MLITVSSIGGGGSAAGTGTSRSSQGRLQIVISK